MKDANEFILAVLVSVLAGLSIGLTFGNLIASTAMKSEAVKKGYAEWCVGEFGQTKFKWKESGK